jgi:phage terminase large subunit
MITVKALEPYRILYKLPGGTNLIICIGGRGGAKTYEVSKFITFSATIKKKRCVILRDEKELVRESILNEVLLRYDTANATGVLDNFYERLETGIKDLNTDSMLVFTKGFRASSNLKMANLKSISDIDIAVVEEAEDIRDEMKFNTFADSIRKEGSLIIIILNTPDIQHWIIRRYFNLVPARDERDQIIDGYYQLVPKDLPGFLPILTDFECNPYLPEHIIDNYKNYGNPDSHLYNLHYYLTAIKGYASTGRKGQVITKAKPIKLADYLKLPYKEYYGLDFGTSSPAGIVGVKVHRNQLWARQINYKPMNTLGIAKLFCTLKLTGNDLIVADSADPKAIQKLSHGYKGDELSEEEFRLYPGLRTGFNVIGARKGKDSIQYSIDLIDSMDFYVVEESTDYWHEIFNYIYAQDKSGNYTNEPIDDFNHLIDPTRYVAMEVVKDRIDYGYRRRN